MRGDPSAATEPAMPPSRRLIAFVPLLVASAAADVYPAAQAGAA